MRLPELVSHDDCAVADRAAVSLGTETAALFAQLELRVALLLSKRRAHVDVGVLSVRGHAEVTRRGEDAPLHRARCEHDL